MNTLLLAFQVSPTSSVLSVLFLLLLTGVVLVILVDTGEPSRKFAWLFIIALLPVAGLLLYLLFGINHRHKHHFDRTYRKYRETFPEGSNTSLDTALFGETETTKVDEHYRPLAHLLSQNQRPSVSTANGIEVITEGERKLELLLQDLQNAKKSIYMEYFHFGIDDNSRRIRELLMEKAREGLDVRFINENFANLPIPTFYYTAMKTAGVKVVNFTDLRYHFLDWITHINYRDHRKIVIIDGETGYVGGMNINNHYFYQWRDTHLRLTGEAVRSLEYLFMDSWQSAKGEDLQGIFTQPETESPSGDTLIQIVPDGPDSRWPILQMGYEWTLLHAKEYVYLQSPYFAPPESLLSALKTAALSGIDVRLMLPARPDTPILRPVNRSYYREILEAGVRVYERGGNFMHSKTFVCDDYLTSIGSANLDYRSFCIDYEVNAYVYDTAFARKNKDIFFRDMEQCREITLQQMEEQPWLHRLLQGITRLFAPIL